MMPRTKIICTTGPSVNSDAKIEALVKNGMSLIRINCSHGTPQSRLPEIDRIRRIEKKLKLPIGIMLDLQGPKLRVGVLPEPIMLKQDELWKLSPTANLCVSKKIIPVDFKGIASAVKIGSDLYMDDGLIHTQVVKKRGKDVWIRIKHGGILASRKGINIPDYSAKHFILNKKDKEDLVEGLKYQPAFVAISFVRSAKDIWDVRKFISQQNPNSYPLVIAKIEKPEAVKNMDAIIEVSDGILVARGDLGIELNPEMVPVVQKQLIEKCRFAKKPVIIATQMLDSMRINPRPTRAEVSDVASAIYAGADAVLLTGETSSGKYPVQTCAMMRKILEQVESHMAEKSYRKMPKHYNLKQDYEVFLLNTIQLAEDVGAKAIMLMTKQGIMTKTISKLHPPLPVFSLASNPVAYRQLTLYWGVFPLELKRTKIKIEMRIKRGIEILKKRKVIKPTDRVVFVYRDYLSNNLNLKMMVVD